MTENEKYLFDLNGYILVQGALCKAQVAAMNEAIDHNSDKIYVRTRAQALDGSLEEQGGKTAAGLKGSHGRGDFGGFFFWDEPWCQVFREVITLQDILETMVDVIGPRFRLAGIAGISMTKGAEGFIFHGGGTPELERMREVFYHRFEFGRMYSGLMSVSFALSDQGLEDGGFVCIPGSHKANYLCPQEVRRLEVDLGCVKYFSLKAGDAVIFTEALTHGTVPWKADFERRLLRYLYAPALHTGSAGDFKAIDAELTPLQRVIVQPPYSYQEDTDIAAMLEDQ